MKFTVVVTTYNYAHLLPDALRSLAAQTFKDFELLIVDDGSTDATEEVVRGFSPQLGNCRYLKKPHTGPADSRKVAFEAAMGTHIASLDSDDLWSPEYLASVRAGFERHPKADLLFCDGLHVQDTGTVLRPVFPQTPAPSSGRVHSTEELLMLCVKFCPTGTVFSKDLYERAGPFDVRYGFGLCDDTDWVVRALMAGAYCIRIDRKLFLHRMHGANLTTDPVAYLEPWLQVCRERIKGGSLGLAFEHQAQCFSRDYVVRLLGLCSPSQGRALVAQTLAVFPGDSILRCAYASTYLGSTSALGLLRRGKSALRRFFRQNQRLDLSAPLEVIFQGVK